MKGKIFSDVIQSILDNSDVYQATKYLSEKEIVRATLKRFHKRISKTGNRDIVLTIGRPNFKERLFIKSCKKAGEPFPIKKIQLKKVNKGA
jgi:hypothetical protein